ncbi:MAG TPA: PH domain-containing protein [Casimicrobiaceae bacterium]
MASYVETIVGPGEEVLYVGKVSLWAIASSLVGGVLLILIGLVLAVAHPLGALVCLLGLIVIAVGLIRRASTELAVTTRRVIAKFGFISRSTVEINLAKIESVRVEQSVTGRIFDYGSIIVTGTGSTMDPIPFIADPIRFRQAIQSATDTVQRV